MRLSAIHRRGFSLRGFSLMELMVVVSIIALLISLSLPGLGRAKAKATTVVCSTRIRGLNGALKTYFSEWNETAPLNGLIVPKSGVPDMYQKNANMKAAEVTNEQKWRLEFGRLWTYMGGAVVDPAAALPLPATPVNIAKAYVCPVDMPGLSRTNTSNTGAGNAPLYLEPGPNGNPLVKVGAGGPGYWSYSVNSVFNSLGRFRNRFQDSQGNGTSLPWNDPISMFRVKNQSELITFIEEANESLFNDEVFDAPAYSQGDQITNRHSNGGNVGFADGHVEQFNQVLFNQVPSGISGSFVSHGEAMKSPITRMFFPDRGDFATGMP